MIRTPDGDPPVRTVYLDHAATTPMVPEAVVGMAVYSARAMLHGKGHDVWEMIVENIP